MATDHWVGGGGFGNFGTEFDPDANWSNGFVPDSTQDAVVDTGASALLLGANSNQEVKSIALGKNDVLLINSGSLFGAVNGTGPNVNNGTINLNDADLIIGNTSAASSFDNSSSGSVVLNGTGASAVAALFIAGSVNLTGSGSIEMTIGAPAADNVIVGDFFDGGTNTLTNQTEDISGTGTIGGDLNFINQATVETNNSSSSNGGTLVIEGSAGTGGFTNASGGVVRADNGGTLIFGEDGQSSTIVNNAVVGLDSTGKTTSLQVAGNVTLSGAPSGTIILTGSSPSAAANFDQIVSDGHAGTLTLVNQTLKGAGTIGDANLTLNNQSGTIAATDSGEILELNTGSHTIANGGTIEAVNGARVNIDSPVNSTGTIEALSGGLVFDTAAITGSVNIGANSVLYLSGGTVSGNVTFAGTDGQIWLDNGGPHYGLNGTLVGGQAGDSIINFAVLYSPSMQLAWNQTNSSGGTLSLQQGATTLATFNLAGQYAGSDFSVVPFVDGSVQINLPNPIAAAGTTANMIMRDGSNGAYEIYDLGGNAIQGAYALGQAATAWQVAGVGGFDGSDTADMILRNSSTGALEVVDVSNNNAPSSVSMGQIGLEWTVSGFADFSTKPGETDMLMQNSGNGNFEIYDISNNQITGSVSMGQVGAPWVVAGFGDFSGHAGESGDMLMRNSSTGAFEVYDIANNQIAFSGSMGQVGMEWSVLGFGDFSGNANETDMLMRNSSTGTLELYDISNNQITSGVSIGQVGLEWQVAGFGPINAAGESDMLMRNSSTGAFEVYDITNNKITNAASMGQVGTEWVVAGIAADPPGGASPANAQLAQAMAAFASGGGALGTNAPLNQPMIQSNQADVFSGANSQGHPIG